MTLEKDKEWRLGQVSNSLQATPESKVKDALWKAVPARSFMPCDIAQACRTNF
jgi:hypothetical protein